jgi:hypothetical protein
MLTDLDETLRQLLIQKGRLDPAEVDISFELPTRDWAASSAGSRPTVNLYLYDVRENRTLRETGWDHVDNRNGTVTRKRRPLRIDVSYMITCWTSLAEDQHRLLWRVLETCLRHSPLPDDILYGALREQSFPVRAELAPAEGNLSGVAEFWGAIENTLRPGVNLKTTIELDLDQPEVQPLVLARLLKVGRPAQTVSDARLAPAAELAPGWEASGVRLAGVVRQPDGAPVAGVSVRVVGLDATGQPVQVGVTQMTDANGRYILANVPPAEYTLVVEAPGQAPRQVPITLVARERGQLLPEFTHLLEVSAPAT